MKGLPVHVTPCEVTGTLPPRLPPCPRIWGAADTNRPNRGERNAEPLIRRYSPDICMTSPHRMYAGTVLFLAGFIALMGIITGEIFYPAGYSTADSEISDLGSTRPPEALIYQPSATIFNATMILTGILTILGAYTAYRAGWERWSSVLLALLGVGILGVGVFPGNVARPAPGLCDVHLHYRRDCGGAFRTGALRTLPVYLHSAGGHHAPLPPLCRFAVPGAGRWRNRTMDRLSDHLLDHGARGIFPWRGGFPAAGDPQGTVLMAGGRGSIVVGKNRYSVADSFRSTAARFRKKNRRSFRWSPAFSAFSRLARNSLPETTKRGSV